MCADITTRIVNPFTSSHMWHICFSCCLTPVFCISVCCIFFEVSFTHSCCQIKVMLSAYLCDTDGFSEQQCHFVFLPAIHLQEFQYLRHLNLFNAVLTKMGVSLVLHPRQLRRAELSMEIVNKQDQEHEHSFEELDQKSKHGLPSITLKKKKKHSHSSGF